MRQSASMQLVCVLDCAHPHALADFWVAALEPLDYRRGQFHSPYLELASRTGAGPPVLLQQVPEAKAGKNRLHLDLRVEDLEAEVERLARLGATRTSEEVREHGFRWVVMADPEGNEFCVLAPPAPEQTRPMSAADMQ